MTVHVRDRGLGEGPRWSERRSRSQNQLTEDAKCLGMAEWDGEQVRRRKLPCLLAWVWIILREEQAGLE